MQERVAQRKPPGGVLAMPVARAEGGALYATPLGLFIRGAQGQPEPFAQLWPDEGATLYSDAAMTAPCGRCVTADERGHFPELHSAAGVTVGFAICDRYGREILTASITPRDEMESA